MIGFMASLSTRQSASAKVFNSSLLSSPSMDLFRQFARLGTVKPVTIDEHDGSEVAIGCVFRLESFQGMFQHPTQSAGICKILGEFGSIAAGQETVE